ncbi:hypothetical protein [Streptomyces luteogriseus]|uniref:hypothetical protein n=1 Tax=Streptomyces luteogriseus TaxID=68233 RepID=UPI002E307D21|nr:hypothetical protein [Streptomyces luteogriseus]WTJ30082.1 hypothetical protein OID52_25050 [Streptomyces luteogriseus]
MRARSAVRSATSLGVATTAWRRRRGPGGLIGHPVLTEFTTGGGAPGVRGAAGRRADLIALGRPFPPDPDLVARLRLGAPLNELRDRSFMHVGGATGCTGHPALGAQPADASSDSIVALDGARVA